MVLSFILVTAATTGPTVDLTPILGTGVVGVVLLLIIFTRALVPGWIITSLEKQIAKLETDLAVERDENRKMAQTMQTDVVPALVRAGDVMRDLLDAQRHGGRQA